MQLSLRRLRKEGFRCGISEHYNGWAKQRADLFGAIDIVAIAPGITYGVQTTSAANVSARVKKITAIAQELKAAGWRVIVEGWRKKNNRWISRVVEL